jgi:hypothetical protein
MNYLCDNCGHTEADPPEAKRLHERLDEGGVYTDRECSECGCLTYERMEELVASQPAVDEPNLRWQDNEFEEESL